MNDKVTENVKKEISEEEKRKIGGLKQLVFDTETTGLYVHRGERLIEFAAIEVIGGVPTGKKLHFFFNPERACDPLAFAVHKIPDSFLLDKPLFSECAEEILEFVKGYEVVAHNAKFDMGFMDAQLIELGLPPMSSVVKEVVCTLELAKANYPGRKSYKLDSLCESQGIDLTKRQEGGHNAVLDCELLSEVYMNMVIDRGWDNIRFDPEFKDFETPAPKRFSGFNLPSVKVNQEDLLEHSGVIKTIDNAIFAVPQEVSPAKRMSM